MSRYSMIGVDKNINFDSIIATVPKSYDFWFVPDSHIKNTLMIKNYDNLQTIDYSTTYIDVFGCNRQTLECLELNQEHIKKNFNCLKAFLKKLLQKTSEVYLFNYWNGKETIWPLIVKAKKEIIFSDLTLDFISSLTEENTLLKICRG